ncbi:MAG: NnrU family protein [Thalassovita sp.]|nr:NnrU family protein [Thalassovita sp.]
MIWLILGVLLWSGAHLFKRLAPEIRATWGEKAKGPIALAILLSLILMVSGYRMAHGAVFWERTPMLTGINNLLMLVAIYLFAAAGMKTRITARLRHPQLIGFKIWAVGHLLVNGDVPSFILFGGLLAWAVMAVIQINNIEPDWRKPTEFSNGKEIGALVGTVAVFAIIALIHSWLGYVPFG